jgi:hypothetical protein
MPLDLHIAQRDDGDDNARRQVPEDVQNQLE